MTEEQAMVLNIKIAQALGYKADTATDDYGSMAVIVAPSGIELEYTRRDTDDYGDSELTAQDMIRWAFRDLVDLDMQENADEEDEEDIPPQWAQDASAAAELITLLPAGYEITLKTNRQIEPGKVQWYCSMTYFDPAERAGSGFCDTLAEAICKAWLTAKTIEHTLSLPKTD